MIGKGWGMSFDAFSSRIVLLSLSLGVMYVVLGLLGTLSWMSCEGQELGETMTGWL